jgi:hypothetical protein
MACSCDSCSSPRIIKTRTATFWRWLAQSRGETADRVIPAPVRAVTVPVEGELIPSNDSNLARRAADHAASLRSVVVAPASAGIVTGPNP